MAPSRQLLVRDNSSFDGLTPTMTSLLIALVVLLITGFSLVAILFVLRSRRKGREQRDPSLPVYVPSAKRTSNHRRLTITATSYGRSPEDVRIYNEKEMLPSQTSSGPPSPVPEIRITFPEEEDAAGKRKSGRVVVVKISETGGVGLEPYHDDNLPPYGTEDAQRFQSLDLDRIGGLKEVQLETKRL
ncbi:MAG: hypothetical protein Q9208_008225 [Pyrenodesmia sp. 3 TL-2023]